MRCQSTTPYASILLTSLLLTLCQPASAQGQERPSFEARLPGFEVATGLLQTPSAYVQRSEEVTLFGASERRTTGGALLGITQRFETGGSFGSATTGTGGTLASAKWNVVPETLLTPAISIGVLDALDTSPRGRSTYIVVSKSVIPYFTEALTGQRGFAVKLNLGYGDGLYRSRLFLGGELWTPGGVGVVGELCAGHANLGLRYTHSGVGATLGLLDLRHVGGVLCYTIPLR